MDGNFDSVVYANMDNGGGDLRISSDEAGAVLLNIDVQEFSTVGETAEVWIKVPTLNYNDDTVLYIWGDKTGESQPAAVASGGSDGDIWFKYIA